MPDKVNSRHSEYSTYERMWVKCRDVIAGSERIKAAGDKYLPKLSAQTWDQYINYKNRALFYEATPRTLAALVGTLFRKAPRFGASEKAAEMVEDLKPDSMPMESFLRERLATEVFTTGRVGLLVDVDDEDGESEPYISCYDAESIINWRVNSIGGKQVLMLVVLREEAESWEGKQFQSQKSVLYRVLRLVDGKYFQELWRKVKNKEDAFELVRDPFMPTNRGKPFDSIPFVFLNHRGLGPELVRPPLLGLANVNLSHYQNSADLEHGRHYTGLPTPWVAGFDKDLKGKLKIGAQTAWVTTNADGKAGYLEFTGKGLGTLETALSEKEKMMAILGARLLEAPRDASESAENQRLKRLGEDNVLSSTADAISQAMDEVLRIYAEWANIDEELTIELVKDFSSEAPNPQMLTALVGAFQGDVLSHQTLYEYLQKVEVASASVSFEEELDRIEATRAPGMTGNFERPQGQEPEPEPELEPEEDENDRPGELLPISAR